MRPRRVRRIHRRGGGGRLLAGLVLAAAVLAGGPAPASLSAQESLDELARSLASAWARGNAEPLARRLASTGVAFHRPGQTHPSLPVRQARAALERLLDEGGGGEVRMGRVASLGGDPPRGYAEFRWLPRSSGDAAPYSVFLGFESSGDRWEIVELRILE